MKQGHGVSLLRFSSRIFALILLRVRGSSGSHEATPPMEPSSGLRLCTSKKASKSHPPSSLTGPGMTLVQLPRPPSAVSFRDRQLGSGDEDRGGRREVSPTQFPPLFHQLRLGASPQLLLHHSAFCSNPLVPPLHPLTPHPAAFSLMRSSAFGRDERQDHLTVHRTCLDQST